MLGTHICKMLWLLFVCVRRERERERERREKNIYVRHNLTLVTTLLKMLCTFCLNIIWKIHARSFLASQHFCREKNLTSEIRSLAWIVHHYFHTFVHETTLHTDRWTVQGKVSTRKWMKSNLIKIQCDLRDLVIKTHRVMIVDLYHNTFCHRGHDNRNPKFLVPDRIKIKVSFLSSDSSLGQRTTSKSNTYVRIDSV